MLFGKIDLPDEVWQAALQGELVVFAGAGVSQGAPACLPNFRRLCDEIAEGLGPEHQRQEAEPEDEFLGRLAVAGVPVHQRAVARLLGRRPLPTELHESLIGLFRAPAECRIVTTNFDTLFEQAAQNRALDPIDVFSAPALPIGSSFSGIVHLHGSLTDPPDRLVLTDSDFSRAYLTEGWARRFLRAVADRFVVLFVGFSFNDVPSRYLIRGIPADRVARLSALVHEPGTKRVPAGVRRVPFDDRNDFLELRVGIRQFTEFSSRDAARHRASLLEQIKSLPPPPGAEADYLHWALCDPLQAKYLLDEKDLLTPKWLEWTNERGLLDPLFVPGAILTDAQDARAEWFFRLALESATWKRCAEILAVRHGRMASRTREHLWWVLLRHIKNLKSDGKTLGNREWFWLAVARACGVLLTRDFAREHLLDEFPDDSARAFVDLWAGVMEPRILISPSIPHPGDNRDRPAIRVDLQFAAENYSLRQAWARYQAQAREVAPLLLPVLRAQIEAASRLLRMAGVANDEWDPESFGRNQIGGDSADRHTDREAFSVVIDVARDCLVSVTKEDRDRGLARLEDWLSSTAPLARRLALYVLSTSDPADADGTLRRLVEEGWREIPGSKAEIFAILRRTYPLAGEGARLAFLTAVSPIHLSETDEPNPEARQEINTSRDYEWFNLLGWLRKAAPDDPLAQARLSNFVTAHPDFQPRDHPDLDWTMGEVGWVQSVSPLSEEEVLKLTSEALLTVSRTTAANARTDFRIDQYRGLLEQIGALAASNRDWALVLATQLQDNDGHGRDLVTAILEGLANAELDLDGLRAVLVWLSEQAWIEKFPGPVAGILEKSIAKSATEMEESDLAVALRLVQRLWRVAPALDGKEPIRDWLFRALNHPQGNLGLAALHLASASRKRQRAGTAVGFPLELLSLLGEMVAGDTRTHSLARVVLASQVHFFFAADETFTTDTIIPWFDWDSRGESAVQAWDGFLQWGQIYPSLFGCLLPYLIQTFGHIVELGERRRRLADLLAHYALVPEVPPPAGVWLQEYFRVTHDEDRSAWTNAVAEELESIGGEEAARSWNSWLKSWVGERLTTGFPLLSDQELLALYGIALALPPSLVGEALELLIAHPAPQDKFGHLLFRFEKVAEDLEPADVLEVLILILTNPTPHLHLLDEIIQPVADKLKLLNDSEKKARLRALLISAQRPDLATALLG